MRLIKNISTRQFSLRIFIYIGLYSLLISLIGCLGCGEDMKVCEITQEQNDIISMYKTGNWWLYETPDGLKKDSLYVISVDTFKIVDNRETCVEWYELTIMLGQKTDTQSEKVNELWASHGGVQCEFMSLHFKNYGFISFNNFPFGVSSNSAFEHTLKCNQIYYDNLYKYDLPTNLEIFYKKDIGFVGWVHSQDTFCLTQYYIQ